VVIEHDGGKVGNVGQVWFGVPSHYDFGALCLKRSSQAVGDNPDPLHDQDNATLKGIVIGHCRCPEPGSLLSNHSYAPVFRIENFSALQQLKREPHRTRLAMSTVAGGFSAYISAMRLFASSLMATRNMMRDKTMHSGIPYLRG
jgi:hypothetical protein